MPNTFGKAPIFYRFASPRFSLECSHNSSRRDHVYEGILVQRSGTPDGSVRQASKTAKFTVAAFGKNPEW